MLSHERVVLAAFSALERRDGRALLDLYHDEVEAVEAPSLPYGRTQVSGRAAFARQFRDAVDETWLGTWGPLQPTAAERRLDPRVVASRGDEVVVQYTTRAVAPDGERFESQVLGLYEVRDGKLARLRMHHFDTAAVLAFLERVGYPLPAV